MNNVAFVNRGNTNLHAIEAYRTVALSQGPDEPAVMNGTNRTNGTYGIQDTVELSDESLRLTKSVSNVSGETDDTDARIYQVQKTTRLKKAASISGDESELQGRNEFPPRVSKAGKMGPPAEDIYAFELGGVTKKGIPGSGSTQNNQDMNANGVNNESTTDERLNNNVTVNNVTTGNPLNSAVNNINNNTAMSQTASKVSAGVPPMAPTSLESSEGSDRKESQLKTEDVNKSRKLNSVQRNEASETNNLSSDNFSTESKESEAVRTREFLKDRYREPGIAVYVESNNLTSSKNYTDNTLLQNVGSQIAQASTSVNRISVYA